MTASTKDLIERLSKQFGELDPSDPYRADVGEAIDALERLTQPVGVEPVARYLGRESEYGYFCIDLHDDLEERADLYSASDVARLIAERDAATEHAIGIAADLRAEVSRLTAELAEAKADLAATKGERNAFQDQCVRRKREMDELRAQEPVAELDIWDSFSELPSGTKLFAHPAPSAQAVLDDEWQPIETAPEGVHILLWFPHGERGVGGMECGTIYRGDPIAPGGIAIWTHGGPNSGSDWQLDEPPTLWKPAPKAPAYSNEDALLFAAEAKRSGQ